MEERGWFNRGEKRMTAGEEEAGTLAGQMPHPFDVQLGKRGTS